MGLVSAVGNDLKGAVGSVKQAVKNFKSSAKAEFVDRDFRARIKVPEAYLNLGVKSTPESAAPSSPTESSATPQTTTSETDSRSRDAAANGEKDDPLKNIKSLGGIFFPYTPTISVDNRAEYASQAPYHSNYNQYFYKSSSVGTIQIAGKFTVQDQYEAIMLLATIHILRSLTKMRFGKDTLAGAPPPVCRFEAYGTSMFKNVPVVVSSWKHELPDNVDYITVEHDFFGLSHVPVLSTISVDLNVVYSRQEMLDYNIPEWISGDLKNKGYL